MNEMISPLSNVDAAWLKMEDPTHRMVVTGVMTFPRPIDHAQLQGLVENRLLQIDRFRQRVVRPSLAPDYWVFDPYFDLNAHLHHVGLPHPHDKWALQELVSHLMSTGLDFSKPLWQFHIVDGYSRDGSGAGGALIVRIHHALADGMALIGLLLALAELSPDAPQPLNDRPASAAASNGRPPGGRRGAWEALQQRAAGMVGRGIDAGRRALVEGLDIFLNHDRPRQLAEGASDYAHAASKLVLRAPDPTTIFKGRLGIAKRAVWSRPLPLSEVKAMRQALGVTVNDLMIAAVTGGLRRYLEGRGEAAVDFRAAVPVNLRGADEMGDLGNKFGFAFLDLPVATVDMPRRLALIHYRMEALQESKEAPVSFDMLGAMGFSTQMIQEAAMRMIGAKATTLLTHLPGPPIPLYLAGQPIESLMFWLPPSGRLGLSLSIVSYAGNIFVGIASDASLVPDPDEILLGFYAEYDELLGMI
jgi:WS/DGAT/MGAT family acyltransferase